MKKRDCHILFSTLLLFLLILQRVAAQDVQDFTFTNLQKADRLRSQRIYSICETSDGALWWSSKEGVERYNGVRLKHYPMGNQRVFSHSGGRIFQLAQGKDSSLIAFDNKGGIFVYDKTIDDFCPFANISEMMGSEVLVNHLLVTEKGFWIALREGVWFLDSNMRLTPVVKDCFANAFVKAKDGVLLCTTEGVLFYRIQEDGTPKANMRLQMLLPQNILCGYYDEKYATIWLGGYESGLNILSLDDGRVTATICDLSVNVAHNPIRCFCPYDDNTILIGIDGLGLFKAGRQPTASGHYMGSLLFDANEGRQGVLHGNGIYTILHDSWGNIDIGSYTGGIDIARPVGSTSAVFSHIIGNQQSLLNDRVNCVFEWPSGKLLMGTDNGLSMQDPITHHWQHVCQGTVILSLCLTPQGTILAASYGKGVYEITESGGVRQLYSTSSGVLKDDHVYKVFFDKEGDLWMGCLDGDLVHKSAAACQYYHINNVQDIVQLPDGRMAVSTANGVWLIDKKTSEVSKLDYSAINPDDVCYYVHTLYVHDNGQLWIGTDGGGIYVYDLQQKHCRQLTTADGLPSNVICSISKDIKDRIQVATDQGLSFVDPKQPARLVNVNYCYGIEREYSPRAVTRLHNGFMLYGTTSGAVIINSENIQAINYTSRLRLTGVSCGDEDSREFKKQVYQMLVDRKLQLSYSQRTFELYFESINLRNQFDIVYQYRLGDDDWSQPDDQQYIRFDNVESGEHQLVLRSVSRTCGEILDEIELTIIIGQPWWNSWWMWLVYLCLLALAFDGAWHVYQLHTKYMRLVVANVSTDDSDSRSELREAEYEKSIEANEEDGKNEESTAFIDQATKLVVDHIDDSEFTIDQLCREMAMSRTLFYLRLKSYTGKSPQDFIRVIRLERAAALLRNGRSVTDAAALTGFDNPKYFSTVFKKYFGVSPSRYNA